MVDLAAALWPNQAAANPLPEPESYRTMIHANRLASTLAALSLLSSSASAATTPQVERARIHASNNPARWASQADPVELSRLRGEPLAHESWLLAEADSEGWIQSEEFAGPYAYAYAEVQTDDTGIWLLEGMGYGGVELNGVARVGNLYGYKDSYESWEPHFDYGLLPVRLEAGRNELLFFGGRYGRLRARFLRPKAPLLFNARDVTLPDLVAGSEVDSWGAIVLVNASEETILDAQLNVQLEGAASQRVEIPPLPPLSVHKLPFPLRADAGSGDATRRLELRLGRAGRTLDECAMVLRVVDPQANRRVTFRSRIDDSVQYFGFLAAAPDEAPKALLLSLHGASVEAINQSGSYAPISWGHLLAPTNRRPFGFSWEDWGRLDALEVLQLGMQSLRIDRDRVYLTGHSMGGHGTWQIGGLHPDLFAAIGPSAGWISVWSYRQDARSNSPSALEALVDRATLPSETLELAPNLQQLGVYALHGAEDDNVPPEQSHLMLERLRQGHRDWIYHEEPGVGHWWDLSPDPGADCVAWAPMFDFFARHRRPRAEELRRIRFRTPSPTISAHNQWVAILQQRHEFRMSEVELEFDPVGGALRGRTVNVARMRLSLPQLRTESLHLELDGERLDLVAPQGGVFELLRDGGWRADAGADPRHKSPQRGAAFRAAFARRPQLVYATGGNAAENARALAKARYDAEWLWYQGNASVPVLPDSLFDPSAEPDRSVILYGNADTHGDWAALMDDVVEVRRGRVRIGEHSHAGDDFGVLAIRPRQDSLLGLVAIVAGSGPVGDALLERRPHLKLGISYPDFTLFEDRGDGGLVRAAGFFANDWSLDGAEAIWDGEPHGER